MSSRCARLGHRHEITLRPTAPFNFDATVHKPDHFPSSDVDWQPGIKWQTMLWHGIPLGLKLENAGTVEQPRVTVGVWSKEKLDRAFLDGLGGEISYRYNLELDLTDFNRRFRGDPQLGPVITRWRGNRPMSYASLYHGIIITIVLQNATLRRSVSMLQALFEKYGSRLAYDGKELYCFWEPEALHEASEQDLRELKVGYRAKNIKKVTASFTANGLDEFELRSTSVEEQRRTLLSLYGVGPASVGYILVDHFHHMDELAHISPWEQRIYSKLFFDLPPEEPAPVQDLLAVFEQRFAGYKMLAVHYIWEDLFWKRQHQPLPWLESLIRL